MWAVAWYPEGDRLAYAGTGEALETVDIEVTPEDPRVTDGLQVLYNFAEGEGAVVHDVSGVGTPIDLTIANPGATTWISGGLSIDQSTQIQSAGAATKVIDAVTISEEITIEAWVRPANITQGGPARIVSISNGGSTRDVTLGQGKSYPLHTVYSTRLRTTTTTLNGTPEIYTPQGSITTNLIHVVFTRDASGVAHIYLNGSDALTGTFGGDLSNWNATYPLLLANELSGDRPWLGEFYLVAIYNQALSAEEVYQNHVAGPGAADGPRPPTPTTARVMTDLQAWYTFEEAEGFMVYDVSGVGTPLDLRFYDPTATSWIGGGLSIDTPTIVTSATPATKVIDAVMASNEITLEAWVKPANIMQSGPARILSLSLDPYYRNFTLGQDLSGTSFYDVRLRTTTTNPSGIPSLSSPLGSVTTNLTHVVYTRDAAGTARIYLDGVQVSTATVGGDMSNWDADYHLALANELTNNRPWVGELHLAAIYSRALTAAEVTQNYTVGPNG